MAVHVRPITKSDVKRIRSGIVDHVGSQNFKDFVKGTVCDPALFGKTTEHSRDWDKDYDDEYMRTASISLNEPVLNPFLAGREYKAWRVVLNMDDADRLHGIVQGKVAYDTRTKEFINREDLKARKYDEYIMFGGRLLLHLLDEADKNLKRNIAMQLYYGLVAPVLKECKIPVDDGPTGFHGTIRYQENFDYSDSFDGYLFGNYFYVAPEGEEWLYDEIRSNLGQRYNDMFVAQFSPLTILLAYQNDPSQLRNQVMNDLFVLPLGYRRNIENRIDPLNRQYNKIVSLNNELIEASKYAGNSIIAIMVKYEQLVKYITNVFVGEKSIQSYSGDTFKSLVDTLSGKEGLMRGRMQGVRVDYSGRTVITCDPFMPIDEIGIPKKILPKLIENDIITSMKDLPKNKGMNMSYMMKDRFKSDMLEAGSKIAKNEDLYVIVGRQPTLFYLGIQAFKVRPVNGNSIVLSPLVVMPFNADFDGDQMHIEAGVTPAAKREIKELMASTNNLFYPKNGELTVVVRHEIQYGLWMASKITDKEGAKTWSSGELDGLREKLGVEKNASIMQVIFNGVCKQLINIYDKVPVADGYAIDTTKYNKSAVPAGIAAIKYAIGTTNSQYAIGVKPLRKYGETKQTKKGDYVAVTDEEFSDKWLKLIMTDIAKTNKGAFTSITNKVVKLGFSVAKIWPPSISAMADINITKEVNEFNRRIAEREKFLSRGIEIETTFTRFFEEELQRLNDKIMSIVTEELGPDNGFIRMWKSGAKGNASNIMQTFGIKGRIMKDELTPFNSIIAKSLSSQLNGLEHFITAYGSRQGLADKVLATAQPGYLTRKLEHACSQMVVTEEDCFAGWTTDEFYESSDMNGRRAWSVPYSTLLEWCELTEEEANSMPQDVVREQTFKMFYKSFKGLYAYTSVYSLDESGNREVMGYPNGVLIDNEDTARDVYNFSYIANDLDVYISDQTGFPGIRWTFDDIVQFVDETSLTDNDSINNDSCRNILAPILVGRNIFDGDFNSIYVESISQAYSLYDEMVAGEVETLVTDESGNKKIVKRFVKKGGILMRSPLTCNNPCCQKCYGKDLTSNMRYPKIGKPIGFVAAQAVGEPGTQLTMKNFQKGGVASEANLTSSFDKIDDYLALTDLRNKEESKIILPYDALSPVEGYVRAVSTGDGRKKILVMDRNDDKGKNLLGLTEFYVHENTELKDYVSVGDSFQKVQGDLNIREVLRYRGYDAAVKYLVLILYSIFNAESTVSSKHFEVIVSSMASVILLNEIPGKYNAGTILSLKESKQLEELPIVSPTLLGLKQLPKYRSDFFESMIMEDMKTFVPRAIITNPTDSMTNPKTRLSFGLNIGVGSDYPDYLDTTVR